MCVYVWNGVCVWAGVRDRERGGLENACESVCLYSMLENVIVSLWVLVKCMMNVRECA